MEKLRFKHNFEYEFTVDEKLETEFIQLPSMMIQPYVENAIWHGLMNKENGGKLILNFERENGHLKCVVEDNGVGRKKASELKSRSAVKEKSLGMRVTGERMDAFNRQKENKGDVKVVDLISPMGEAAGTRVEIRFPII